MSQDVQGMLIQIEATTAQLRRELASADQVVARTTQQIDRNLATVDTAFDRTAAGAQQAGQLIRGAFAAMAGAGLVGALIQQADAVGQMDDRMRAATGGSMEYEMVQRRLLQTAQDTYRPLREAQELYIRTADAVRAMGYDTQQTLDITDSFSYLLVTNAASADKASGALDAYSKALQTGKVEADGWTTIVSAMPTVVDAIATATGQSAAEVRRLGASGKLALDDINRGLLETLESNRQAAADMSVSVADALNNIGNAVQVYIGQLNQSSGATDGLAEALGVVAENIDVVAAVVGGVAAGALGVYTRAAVVAAAETVKGVQAAVADRAARIAQADAVLQAAIADQRKAQTAVILAQREAEAARGTAIQTQMSIQLAQARQREAAATAAVTAAQTGLRQASTGLLGLLGGPMGIAMLAGSAAAAFLLLRNNTDEVAGSLGDLKTPLEQVRAEFERLGDAEQRLQLTRLSQQIEQEKTKAASALDELREAFANSLYGGSGNRAPSPEAEAALGRLGKAMAAASQGQPVNWLAVAESMRGVQGVSTTLVEKTLAVAAGQEASARTTAELQARHDALTASLDEGTRAQRENAAASAEAVEAGDKYIAQLEKRLGALQDKTALQAANRFIAENTGLTAEQVAKIRELAAAQDAQRAAEARATESAKAGKKATEEKLQALAALVAKYDPAAKAQADYEQGIRLADEALLKGAYTTEQYQAVVQGLWVELNKPGWEKFNKGATETEARLKRLDEQVRAVSDRLDPAAASARKLADEKKLLREAVDAGALSLDEFRLRMRQLDDEYARNQRATSAWAQWTDSALERVDSAFADAWRNIGDGFDGFRDSLTNAFKQMLAELAHLAITRPIVMQIGAALGIGGGAGQVSSMLGSSGSGSAGGLGFGDISNAFSLYQASQGQGFLGSVWSGYQSGGLSGAWSGATGYGSGLLSGIDASAGQLYGTLTNGASATYAPLSYQAQVNGWSGVAEGAAPWLAGLGGAYMGYQQGGWKGAIAGGAGGFGGAKLGAMAGAAVGGPIGAAIGAALGGIVGSIGGASLFGGGEQFDRTVGSAMGRYEGGEYKSSGVNPEWFPGSKSFGAEFNTSLDSLNRQFSGLLGGLFEAFDIDSTIKTEARTRLRRTSGKMVGDFIVEIDGAVTKNFRQYAKGGNIQKAMGLFADDILGEYLAEAIVASDLPEYLRDQFVGLTEADEVAEALSEVIARFDGVNNVLEMVNVALVDASDSGLRAADAIIAAAGGLDALQAGAATYYDQFFTGAEKAERTIDLVKAAFERANIELANSRAGYRAMVEDIDVTTQAGQEMFATMMALSGQAAQYYSIIEQQAEAAAAQAAAAAAQAAANAQLYYDQFTTAAQKIDDALAGIVAQFSAMDVALPATRAGFVAAVDALDTTTEAGKKMFDTLMSVAGAADAYYDILEARAASVSAGTANAAVAASRGALSTLSAAINAEKSSIASAYQAQADSIRSAIGSANDSLSQMRSVASSLRSAVNGLLLESEQYAAQSRRGAQQTIGQALSGGGRVQMTEQLERALDTVSQSSEDLFGSFEDYARDYWQTYFAIEQLAGRAEDQLSADEQAVKALERQLDQSQRFHDAEIERLDGVLEGANAQLEALLGIDTSVQSVETALAAFTAALAAAQQLQNANSSITSVTGIGGVKRQVTSEGYILDELGNQMELFGDALRVVGNKVVGGAGASLNIGADGQLSWGAGDYAKWAKQAGIPGFATGGSHVGGLRVVGEHGPELELTGPARLLNANQTAAALRGDSSRELVAEVRALRQTVAAQGAELRDIARSSDETRKALRQQNEVGVPAWSG